MNKVFKIIIFILLYILFLILVFNYSLFNNIYIIVYSVIVFLMFLFYLWNKNEYLYNVLILLLVLLNINYFYNRFLFKDISYLNKEYLIIEKENSNKKLGLFEYDNFKDFDYLNNYETIKYQDMTSIFNDLNNNTISYGLVNANYYSKFLDNNIISKDDFKIKDTLRYTDIYKSLNDEIKSGYTIFVEGINSNNNIEYARIVSINIDSNKLFITQIPSDYYIELYSISKREKIEYLNNYSRNTIKGDLGSLFNTNIDYIIEFNTNKLIDYISSNYKYCFNNNYSSSIVSYKKGCYKFSSSQFTNLLLNDYSIEKDLWDYLIKNYKLDKKSLLKFPITTDISKEVLLNYFRGDFKYKKGNTNFYKLEGLAGHDKVLSSNIYEWIEYPNYESVSIASDKMRSVLEIDN